MRYFKLVATNNNKQEWMLDEFLAGRARFGWSWIDCDLNKFPKTNKSQWSDTQKISWTYTQFLIKRINIGDRVVIQHKQPLREFLIGEVIDDYRFDSDPSHDFNHILPIKPLHNQTIKINSKIVPSYLRKALTKRGHYYEIYPNDAISKLEDIIDNKLWLSDHYTIERKFSDDLSDAKNEVLQSVRESIRKHWKTNDFERFIAKLFNTIPGVELKVLGDSGKGWDLILQITDPLTLEVLHEEVPVQCKAYKGNVATNKPIDDIVRAIKSSKAQLGYIAILGNITEKFEANLINAKEQLCSELNQNIDIKVVTEENIAELALRYSFFTNDEENT